MRRMKDDPNAFVNGARFASLVERGDAGGHYESWFQRANHPTRPLAFWIRYTVFAPSGRPQDAVGELWAIWFDRERGEVTAAKREVPVADCAFSADGLDVRIADATLVEGALEGAAESGGHRLEWRLSYRGGQAPLLLLPRRFYDGGFPKAKALVGRPLTRYAGEVVVDGETHAIEDWPGSQNHNWGSRHTDEYAWGQVAGFDDEGDAFLECTTARVRAGPIWTPWLTLVVLRLDGRTYALNGALRALRARGRFGEEGGQLDWRFDTRGEGIRLRGHVYGSPQAFVGLRYGNPPGGDKVCLNSKVAGCTLVVEQPGRAARTLHSAHGAAFEVLGDTSRLGIPVVA